MKYLVIGLSNLGRAIAENLTSIGNEVIGIDQNPHRVDAVKQSISGAVCLDSTDRDALNTLALSEMDAIFVTYGKDFGISVQTVALLKSLEANKLIVRVISPIHETVIRSIGVSEVITPEQDYAAIYASRELLGDLFKHWFKITETHHLYKIKSPETLVGQDLGTIKMEENFGLRLVAIERMKESQNLLGLRQKQLRIIDQLPDDLVIEQNDSLLLFGRIEVLHKIAEI
ncbi:MAG: TrkA family potassium uptake protein [Tannerellaceae bacterium]